MSETKRFNFTKAALEALPNAATGQRDTYHDTRQPALAVRVTETGKKTFRVRGRPRGQFAVETLTIGPFPAVTIDQARAQAADQLAKWARTESLVAERRADEQRRRTEIALDDALREYVENKRRGKDGLALKPRTRDDYLRMVQPAKAPDGKRPIKAGELSALASRPLTKITADDIRRTHAAIATDRGDRRAAYAMAVLRAVLNWHGVKVADNPLGREVAGRDRIRLPQVTGNPSPIPAERLGAWWRAASAPAEGEAAPDATSDYLRFLLLTGCRSIEVKGSRRGKMVFGASLTVADVDLISRRAQLRDTKNRSDHTVHLSDQALAIVRRHMKDKTPAAPIFSVGDVRPRLQAINEAAGVAVSPHDLRATFASIAEELVSVYALKRMLNHAAAGDVTAGHYVAKSETQLRAGWQAVADFIDEQAAKIEANDQAKDAQSS